MHRIAGKALSPDDVVLLPQYSDIITRSTIDLSQEVFGFKLKYPIISSNMDTVTEYETAKTMWKAGALGILHRYKSPEIVKSWIKKLQEEDCVAIASVGVKPGEVERAIEYLNLGAKAVCIDVAHGDHELVFKAVKSLIGNFDHSGRSVVDRLIVGNVVTIDAATRLCDLGVSVIKVGIGNGSICSTRVMTGHGLPQITALFDVSQIKKRYPKVKIISDGGVKNSGDIVKVLAAGADLVISGSLFAGCKETPKLEDGTRGYRGMASREARQAFYGKDYQQVPEGEAFANIPEKGSVATVVEELVMGVKSGLSYSGASNLVELHQKAVFYEVTTAGYTEGTPHYRLKI